MSLLENHKQHADFTSSGFTLIELLITLAIFSIILSFAVPSMSSFSDKRHVVGAAEDLYSNLRLAKMESLARSTFIFVRFNSSNTTWTYGISQNPNCTLTVTDPTAAGACLLVVDDGDGIVDGVTDPNSNTNAVWTDADDRVLYRFTESDYNNVTMTLTNVPNNANGNPEISFEPIRGTASIASILLQSPGGRQMRITVGVLGQIRLCSPAGNVHVGGYSSVGCT